MTELAEEGSPQSQLGKQKIVSEGQKSHQLSLESRVRSEMGEGGSYNPIANTSHKSTGYSLRAFGINCLGVQGEQGGTKRLGSHHSLGSAKIPKCRKEDPSTSRHSHLDARSRRARSEARWTRGWGWGGRVSPTAPEGSHRHTQTDAQTGSQLAPGGVGQPQEKRRRTPRALIGRTPAPQTHSPTHNHTHTR